MGTRKMKGAGHSSEHASTGASARRMINHEEIRRWAAERGAVPTCVKHTGGKGDVGMLRLEFPGYGGGESLQEISWDDWFEEFDTNDLALIVQDTTSEGEKSNFNKLVRRTAEDEQPRTRKAS
jgi:hypothetical protein